MCKSRRTIFFASGAASVLLTLSGSLGSEHSFPQRRCGPRRGSRQHTLRPASRQGLTDKAVTPRATVLAVPSGREQPAWSTPGKSVHHCAPLQICPAVLQLCKACTRCHGCPCCPVRKLQHPADASFGCWAHSTWHSTLGRQLNSGSGSYSTVRI